VSNGAEVIVKLVDNSYDAVILDIFMPIMDGEATIKAIRGSSRSKVSSCYCIALTATSFQDQKSRLLNLGFDAFLSKPLTIKLLANSLLDVAKSIGINELPYAAVSNESIRDKSPRRNMFDYSYLESQFGEAHKFIFKEIAPTFLEHAYSELQQLVEQADNRDPEKIRQLSHSIKGASSSLGLGDLADMLLIIENDPSAESIGDKIMDVQSYMQEIKPIIELEVAD
jgi:CheY-like chemotaxis protein